MEIANLTEGWVDSELIYSPPSNQDIIWDQLSEKDRLIMAIQKLWSVQAYLYAVQITTEENHMKYDYYKARDTVASFITSLCNELFNVNEIKQKYYESMTRNKN